MEEAAKVVADRVAVVRAAEAKVLLRVATTAVGMAANSPRRKKTMTEGRRETS